MKRNLTSIKNAGWAMAIMLCLLALFVALIIAAVTPYSGKIVRGGPLLGQSDTEVEVTEGTQAVDETLGELLRVPESADAGQAYIDGLTFLCDSSVIGLRDYGLLSGGTATTQVWGSAAGNIPAGNLADCRIRYPGDGSELTPAEAAARDKPSRLLIVLGTDGLNTVDEDSFVEGYVSLIRSIQEASPNTVIVVCSVSSVATNYSGVDGVNANVIRTVNEWITVVCMRTGVYYCDAGSAVNDRAGWLDGDYASVNGKALNTEGLRTFLAYLRIHAI